MHSRYASFTFILIVTCSSICSFVRGSSDVTDGCLHVNVNQAGCLIKESNSTVAKDSERTVRNLNFSTTDPVKRGDMPNRQLMIKESFDGNNTLSFTFGFSKNNNSEVSERKLKMKMSKTNVLALLFIPAMWIAGMMPWILPGIKMAAMMVAMMNNMAFSSALFSLIRGYLFDTQKEDHIVYLNYGYKHNGKPGHHKQDINYKNNPYLYPHKPVAGAG